METCPEVGWENCPSFASLVECSLGSQEPSETLVGKAGIIMPISQSRTPKPRGESDVLIVSEARIRTQVPGSLPLSPSSWSLDDVVEGVWA